MGLKYGSRGVKWAGRTIKYGSMGVKWVGRPGPAPWLGPAVPSCAGHGPAREFFFKN